MKPEPDVTRDEISRLIEASGLMRRLARFDPHWVGSTYLGLHDDFSDIDICCSFAPSLEATRTDVEAACGVFGDYDLTDEIYGGQPSRIVRFRMGGIPVEVWGRAHPVHEHEFYRFTQVEQRLLALHGPDLREDVVRRRRGGADTETAFVRALGFDAPPHVFLLDQFDKDDSALRDLREAGPSA
ncbi:HIT family protein [Hyphomonas jannaschiana VP2]|uniref:HIT family protein n=1 Tax=Hyphomonas jannaschiana VP2 TaxID=1280952 RepID=A0A059F7Y0_9PROT|nr:HIT family protein [Hyphomonas jannaschiana VP2]